MNCGPYKIRSFLEMFSYGDGTYFHQSQENRVMAS